MGPCNGLGLCWCWGPCLDPWFYCNWNLSVFNALAHVITRSWMSMGCAPHLKPCWYPRDMLPLGHTKSPALLPRSWLCSGYSCGWGLCWSPWFYHSWSLWWCLCPFYHQCLAATRGPALPSRVIVMSGPKQQQKVMSGFVVLLKPGSVLMSMAHFYHWGPWESWPQWPGQWRELVLPLTGHLSCPLLGELAPVVWAQEI